MATAQAGKRVTFLASFPPIQSAIKRGQDGMRIQLDIPESEMGNAVQLIALMNTVLRITVEIAPASRKAAPTGDFKLKD